jgi:hypothetical protein
MQFFQPNNQNFEPSSYIEYKSTPSGHIRKGDGPMGGAPSVLGRPEDLSKMLAVIETETGLLNSDEAGLRLGRLATFWEKQLPPTAEKLIEK